MIENTNLQGPQGGGIRKKEGVRSSGENRRFIKKKGAFVGRSRKKGENTGTICPSIKKKERRYAARS